MSTTIKLPQLYFGLSFLVCNTVWLVGICKIVLVQVDILRLVKTQISLRICSVSHIGFPHEIFTSILVYVSSEGSAVYGQTRNSSMA